MNWAYQPMGSNNVSLVLYMGRSFPSIFMVNYLPTIMIYMKNRAVVNVQSIQKELLVFWFPPIYLVLG